MEVDVDFFLREKCVNSVLYEGFDYIGNSNNEISLLTASTQLDSRSESRTPLSVNVSKMHMNLT
jgi:hypothetical protein